MLAAGQPVSRALVVSRFAWRTRAKPSLDRETPFSAQAGQEEW